MPHAELLNYLIPHSPQTPTQRYKVQDMTSDSDDPWL